MFPFAIKIAPFLSPFLPPLKPPWCFGNPCSPDSKSLPENRSKCPRPDRSQVTFKRWKLWDWSSGKQLPAWIFCSPPWPCSKREEHVISCFRNYANDTQNLDFATERPFDFLNGVYSIVYILYTCFQSPIWMKINLCIFGVILDCFFGRGLTATLAKIFKKFPMWSFTRPFRITIESRWNPENSPELMDLSGRTSQSSYPYPSSVSNSPEPGHVWVTS